MRARDYVNVLARSVPIQQANKVLEEGVAVDIVKIGNQVRSGRLFCLYPPEIDSKGSEQAEVHEQKAEIVRPWRIHP